MSEHIHIAPPSLRRGWYIFTSRPLSLVVVLLVAVVLSVVSFMLLIFPLMAGYYHAVRYSQREEYFIDLVTITHTIGLLLRGMKIHFLQSYLLAIFGLFPSLVLFGIPVIPMYWNGEEHLVLILFLQFLFLPAFFIAVAVFFYGYPCLIAGNNAMQAISYAYATGGKQILLTTLRGFVLLSPVPGWLIHFFMILTYPILVAWAVSDTGDTGDEEREIETVQKATPAKVGLLLLLAFVCVGLIFLLVPYLGAAGLFIPLVGLFLVLMLLVAMKVI